MSKRWRGHEANDQQDHQEWQGDNHASMRQGTLQDALQEYQSYEVLLQIDLQASHTETETLQNFL
jgi:hypothetical protein